jgi:hypothetical protein
MPAKATPRLRKEVIPAMQWFSGSEGPPYTRPSLLVFRASYDYRFGSSLREVREDPVEKIVTPFGREGNGLVTMVGGSDGTRTRGLRRDRPAF